MVISKPLQTAAIDMSGTTVPAASTVTVVSSLTRAASRLQAYNGSTKPIQLLAGPAGTTAVPITIAPGQMTPMLDVSGLFGASAVVKAKAIGADATTGFLVLNFFG